MPNLMMYDEDHFVVLEPDQPEEICSREELLAKLTHCIETQSFDLPKDVQRLASRQQQAEYLMESYCEIETRPGYSLQWYVIRLEK